MDLVSVSTGISNPYTSFFNNSANNSSSELKSYETAESGKGATSNIVVVKKGSTGYMSDVDFDDDGTITLEEFNKYCEENGVSEKDKMALMTTMEFSKVKENLINKNVNKTAEQDSQAENSEDKKSVYAKKGDKEYNEVMDTNNDGTVTYAEYVSYCSEQAGYENKNSSKKELQYSKSENSKSEITSTCEYEV